MTTATTPVWFVTGATSGLGRAFADEALAQGLRVVATGRRTDALAALAQAHPERLLVQPLDVTQAGAPKAAIDAAIARFGRIDVLVNSAGYGIVGAVEETPEDELRAQMETNFFGAVAVIRAALPHLRAQGSGAIVNISSLGGQLSFAGFGAYSASKFALEGLSEALAQEVAPLGIKVLIVEPGAFRTRFAGDALRHMPTLAAYQATVGPTRDFAHGMDQTQQGDPARAPAAVTQALGAAQTPLRLALGADAVRAIRTHGQALLADLAAWETVSLSTEIDPAARVA